MFRAAFPALCLILSLSPAAGAVGRIGLDDLARMREARESEDRRKAQEAQLAEWVALIRRTVRTSLMEVGGYRSREGALIKAFESVSYRLEHHNPPDQRDLLVALADAVSANEQALQGSGAYRTPAPPEDSEQGEELRALLAAREELLIGADFVALATAEIEADRVLAARNPRLRRLFRFAGNHGHWMGAVTILGLGVWGLGVHWADVSGTLSSWFNDGWYHHIQSVHPDWSAAQIRDYMIANRTPRDYQSFVPGLAHVGVFAGGGITAIAAAFVTGSSQDKLRKYLDGVLERLREKHKNANATELEGALRQAVVANQVVFEMRLMDVLGVSAAKALLGQKEEQEQQAQMSAVQGCVDGLAPPAEAAVESAPAPSQTTQRQTLKTRR